MTFTLGNGFVFSIDPVLFRIGALDVYWYGFVFPIRLTSFYSSRIIPHLIRVGGPLEQGL